MADSGGSLCVLFCPEIDLFLNRRARIGEIAAAVLISIRVARRFITEVGRSAALGLSTCNFFRARASFVSASHEHSTTLGSPSDGQTNCPFVHSSTENVWNAALRNSGRVVTALGGEGEVPLCGEGEVRATLEQRLPGLRQVSAGRSEQKYIRRLCSGQGGLGREYLWPDQLWRSGRNNALPSRRLFGPPATPSSRPH